MRIQATPMPQSTGLLFDMSFSALPIKAATILAAIFVAGCQSTPGNKVSVDYYQISGNSTAALDQQIKTKGPKVGGDQHAIAVARIRMIPDVTYKFENGSCAIDRAKISVDARVTLPEWTGRKNASRMLGRVWDNIDRYARQHEAVHVSIAFKYASQMETALLELPPRKSCNQLKSDSRWLVDDYLKAHDAAQKKFDADEQKRISEAQQKADSAANNG